MQSLHVDRQARRRFARASFLNPLAFMTALAAVSKGRLLRRRGALQRALEQGTASQRAATAEELSETEAALARIEEGKFGRCDGCGRAIGRQRLLALPAARLCIECTSRIRFAG
jgi:DnaK suppressor protein